MMTLYVSKSAMWWWWLLWVSVALRLVMSDCGTLCRCDSYQVCSCSKGKLRPVAAVVMEVRPIWLSKPGKPYLVRVASFAVWPVQQYEQMVTGMSLLKLAAAGFSYVGKSDGIACFRCNVVIEGWLENHQSPHLEHKCPSNNYTDPVTSSDHYSTTSEPSVAGIYNRQNHPERDSDATHLFSDGAGVSQQLDVHSQAPVSGTSQLTRQMELLDVYDDVAISASDDVRDSVPAPAINEEEQMIMNENLRLREAKTCKVCMDQDINTVFLPCGHFVACDHCSPKLRNCPVCRSYIRGTVRTFLS